VKRRESIPDALQFATCLFCKINKEWTVVVRERNKGGFLTIWKEKAAQGGTEYLLAD
jgi:hypothetical protein